MASLRTCRAFFWSPAAVSQTTLQPASETFLPKDSSHIGTVAETPQFNTYSTHMCTPKAKKCFGGEYLYYCLSFTYIERKCFESSGTIISLMDSEYDEHMIPYTEPRRQRTKSNSIGNIAGTTEERTNWMIAAETAVYRLGKKVSEKYKTLKMNG